MKNVMDNFHCLQKQSQTERVCVGWGEVAERKSQRLNSTKHERPRCVYLIPYGQVASIKAILQDLS